MSSTVNSPIWILYLQHRAGEKKKKKKNMCRLGSNVKQGMSSSNASSHAVVMKVKQKRFFLSPFKQPSFFSWMADHLSQDLITHCNTKSVLISIPYTIQAFSIRPTFTGCLLHQRSKLIKYCHTMIYEGIKILRCIIAIIIDTCPWANHPNTHT